MTEQEFQNAKDGLLQIIQDASQPARERIHAADTLIALVERWEAARWNWLGSPVQSGEQAGGKCNGAG